MLKIVVPEASINYEKETHDAVDWQLNDSQFFLRLDPTRRYKQNIFVSKSEVYFENKWSFHEINSVAREFHELHEGSIWTESPSSTKLNSIFFRASLKKHIYSSDPYKFLSLLGDIGGYLELIMAFGILMTYYFVQH